MEMDYEIHAKVAKYILVFKTYKEVKLHSSEESEDQVVDGEIDNGYNDECVYYFLMEISPARSQ